MNALHSASASRGHFAVAFLITALLLNVLAWLAGIAWLMRVAWRHGAIALALVLLLWLLLAGTRHSR